MKHRIQPKASVPSRSVVCLLLPATLTMGPDEEANTTQIPSATVTHKPRASRGSERAGGPPQGPFHTAQGPG